MAITVLQTPSAPFDMAYGANPITLGGIDTIANADKYALRIFIVGNAIPIADIRQTPNRVGRAVFDIQNVLQSYVGPQVNTIDSLHYPSASAPQAQRMALAGPTLIEYQIAYATESGGVVSAFTTFPEIFTTIAGSKEYFEVPFNVEPYQVNATAGSPSPGCTVIVNHAGPLSDNQWTIPDELPGKSLGFFSSPAGIDVHNVYADDQCTKTFYSPIFRNPSNPPSVDAQGLEGFYIAEFNSADQPVASSFISNTQLNGGGPNITQNQGTLVSGQFQTITLGIGPANLPQAINANTAYYYIIPVIAGCSTAPDVGGNVMSEAAWRAQKFIINTEPCNDYPHVQFAWQNSLGYRDQFTFTKRVDHSTKTQNNNFLKGAADYNSLNYNVNIEDRGLTTYSQKIENMFKVQSGYMNNDEAKLLKHLHQSAEVKVRFSEGPYADQWVPVIITNTAYTEKTYRKDRLFQYTVNFKLATNIKSMRG